MFALGVMHQNLGGVPGKAVGQNRNKGAALTAGEHGVDDGAAVGAQHAAVVGHCHAGGALHRQVDQARRPATEGRVLAVVTHGRHDVEAQGGLFHQARDLFRRVLQVGVEGDDHLAAALLEAGHDRCMLAVVTVEDHRYHVAAVFSGGVFKQLGRVVAATVIHQDDFVFVSQLLAGCRRATQQFRQALLFVVDRDNDRHAMNRVGFQRFMTSGLEQLKRENSSNQSDKRWLIKRSVGLRHSFDFPADG